MQADPDRRNSLNSGHRACQGCGEALAARYVLDAAMRATGGQLVAVNATGCLEVFSTPYPESSWQLPWLHSLFANAASVATGVAAALKAKGRTTSAWSARAATAAPSTSASPACPGCSSATTTCCIVCYDNEAYMNTGVQRSGATPPAAAHGDHPGRRSAPGNDFGKGKNLPRIAMAHGIPYVATATVAELRDLGAQGASGRCPSAARATCTSWFRAHWAGDRAANDTIKARPARHRSGLFPVFEAEHGEVIAASPIRSACRWRTTYGRRGRFAHLFGEHAPRGRHRHDPGAADRNIARYGLLDRGDGMER